MNRGHVAQFAQLHQPAILGTLRGIGKENRLVAIVGMMLHDSFQQ
jgi:hypothetical protein